MTKGEALADAASASGQGVRNRTAGGRSILLVDDNPDVARAISLVLARQGWEMHVATGPEAAFSSLAQRRFDAILLDLNFTGGRTSGEEGFACLARIMRDDPAAAVVVITAHSGLRIAVAAMQAGALDFVTKPWRNADLVARIEAAIAKRRRPTGISRPAALMPEDAGVARLLGDSAAMEQARLLIGRVAPTGANVLVSGPSGSGRMLAASLIHAGSAHADTPPVTLDARDPAAREGVERLTGTLVLRHPDLLDDVVQAQLVDRLPPHLRAIGVVEDPDRLNGRLRARLGTVELPLPPLAERGEDALLLARHFARVAAQRYGKAAPLLTATAEAAVLDTRWPGEVRGLMQAIERAVLLGDDGVLDAAGLAPRLVQAIAAAGPPAAAPLDVSLEQSERVMIETALRRHHHNIARAAAALGLSRQALYRRMERHGL